MILIINIDSYYLSKLKSHIRVGGNFFVGSQHFKHTRETNDTVHTESKIMKNVMVSAAEVEVGSLLHNGQ